MNTRNQRLLEATLVATNLELRQNKTLSDYSLHRQGVLSLNPEVLVYLMIHRVPGSNQDAAWIFQKNYNNREHIIKPSKILDKVMLSFTINCSLFLNSS